MRFEAAVCVAIVLWACGLLAAVHGRGRGLRGPRGAIRAGLAGAFLGAGFFAAGAALALAGITEDLAAASGWRPELFTLFCLAVVLLWVRDDPLAPPWWLAGVATAAASAWLPGWFPGLPAVPTSPLVQAAAVAASLALAPGRRSHAIARARMNAVRAAGDGILVVDARACVIDANEAAVEALALPADWRHAGRASRLPEAIRVLLEQKADRRLRLKTRRGRFLEAWTSQPESPRERGALRAVLLRDITDQHRAERNLLHLAHYDSLTGLVNRRFFLEALKRDLDSYVEGHGLVALFYIDLDRFKEINDSLGHAAGDALLQELAERFRKDLVPDGPEGGERRITIARLAGDEFAVSVARATDPEAAADVARRIVDAVAQPISVEHGTINSSASVGISLYPRDGEDMEQLMRSADAALYHAKSRGRNCFAFYETSIDTQLNRSTQIADGLRLAIERGELSLHYQPKVDLESRTVASFEALMRWSSAELGEVGPGQFIPIAEERGLITMLGSWALDEACRQVRAWRDGGYAAVPVSVNVARAQFLESDLQGVVTQALQRHEVEPELLELELTESQMFDGGEATGLALRDLRSMGVRVALDDFGTGFSSLATLNQLPLDVLKMDRGFVREIQSDHSAGEVVSAVVGLARGLGLCVVAEGVDSSEQLALLREMGCHQVQGFVYSPAVPAGDAVRFMAHRGGSRPTIEVGAPHPAMLPAEPAERAKLREAAMRKLRPDDKELPSRVLLVDGRERELGTLALRLTRLGIDLHYAPDVEEGYMLIAQERRSICAIVVPPTIDLDQARRLQASLRDSAQILFVGAEPGPRVRAAIRDFKCASVLWPPFEDHELVFLLKSALAREGSRSNRREIRVPVNLNARVHAGPRREVVVLSSLSRHGAFLEMPDPPDVDSKIRLEFDLPTDRFRLFARVIYRHDEDPARPCWTSGVGVVFYGVDRETELRLAKFVDEEGARYLP